VAHIERTRDVHDGCLGQTIAAQNVLSDFQNAFGGQNHILVHLRTPAVVSLTYILAGYLSRLAGKPFGLFGQMLGNPLIEPTLDLGG
jgi:hypothetical protein